MVEANISVEKCIVWPRAEEENFSLRVVEIFFVKVVLFHASGLHMYDNAKPTFMTKCRSSLKQLSNEL